MTPYDDMSPQGRTSPTAPLIDGFGRTVSYLRLSVTDRCDLRCVYCMAEHMTFLPKAQVLTLEELDRIASAFVALGTRKLRLTGGEPLVRKGMMGLVRNLSRHLASGALNELTLTTNGTRLRDFAHELADAGVRRINVSIDTLKPDLFRKLTTMGEYSPLLRMADDNLENRQIWNSFPGVRWTARVSGARPTAQVFLVDTNPDHATDGEPMPVIAQQTYGQGAVMYFGFDETYRWRSKLGEKFYSKIWNQIIQNFSLDRQLGASARTQLKPDRPEYMAGDKVVISGKLFTQSFAPLKEATVPGTLVFMGSQAGAKEESSDVRLLEVPDQPGSYQLDFVATRAGEYRFSTLIDPRAIVKFTVSPPKLEQAETAMDASLLQAMADASGGKFLREENLNELPALISSRSATVPTFKKHELFYSPWWMVVLVVITCTEWLLRRLWQLK